MTVDRVGTEGAALLERHGASSDVSGRLHEDVVAFLKAMNFDKILVPGELGGLNLNLPETFDLVEQLSYLDASVGWVCMAMTTASGWPAACLPESGAERMFPGSGYSGVGAPGGVLKPVAGGYRLTGKWSYASGLLHSEWTMGAGMLEEGGRKRPLFAYLPASEVTQIHDWDTLGLKGTGSISFTANDVFIAKDMVVEAANPAPVRRRELFGIGFPAMLAVVHGAWATGTARRAVDEAGRTMAERAESNTDDLYTDFASASFRVHAAASFSREAWNSIQAKIDAGVNVSTTDITHTILALNGSTTAGLDAAGFLFGRLGSRVTKDGPIQRLFRDISTGATHATSSKSILLNVGRQLTGAAGDVRWGPRFALLANAAPSAG